MGKHYEMPVVEMAARTRTLNRWFQYGDGARCERQQGLDALEQLRHRLLDAQQYAESERAFEHVVAFAAGLCRRLHQRGHRRLSWQRYDAARASLDKALHLAPHNARALYYLALVERTQGIWRRPSAIFAR